MRTTKELLHLVRQTVQEERINGICAASVMLAIREEILLPEYYKLSRFLQTNLPPRVFDAFCWPPGEKEPRLKWLDEQILLLESYEGEKKG
jgi:hypothetical protein